MMLYRCQDTTVIHMAAQNMLGNPIEHIHTVLVVQFCIFVENCSLVDIHYVHL